MKILVVLITLYSSSIAAQELNLYRKQWFIQNGDTLPYRILYPEKFDPSNAYPLLLVLHGRGESGDDNQKQLTHGGKLFLRDSIRKNYPAIVIFPQCAEDSYWSNAAMVADSIKSKRTFYFSEDGPPSTAMFLLMGLVNNLFKRLNIDKSRVYTGGLSMGGMGTYELVRRMPNTFAAAFAICGGADASTAKQLRKTKWWIFHGLKDDIVLPQFSKDMAEALTKAGADVKLTLYPNANHNAWDPALAEKDLLPWLFSQRKNKNSYN